MNTSNSQEKRNLLFVWLTIGLLVLSISDLSALNVEGNVSGEWTIENTPYVMIGSVFVPEGDTLIIHPGVVVIVLSHYTIEVSGLLIAEGIDDDRISMRGDNCTWGGLYFRRESDIMTRVINCDIRDVWTGISCDHNYMRIAGNQIEARNVAISCVGASPTIEDNRLIQVIADNASLAIYAISLRDGSHPYIINNEKIECRSTAGGMAIGILIRDHQSTPSIEGNWLEVSSQRGAAYGILTYRVNKLNINRNIIRVQSPTDMRGLWAISTTAANFFNNNVLLLGKSVEGVGIWLDVGSNFAIVNNIVIGNNNSIGIDSDSGHVDQQSGFNNFWQHAQNYQGFWEGFHDISADPKFIRDDIDPDFADYHLRWPNYPNIFDPERSPCIDTGSPDFMNDPDNTTSDMGRHPYFEQVNEIHEIASIAYQYQLSPPYPNPFNSTANLKFTMDNPGYIKLSLYDQTGRLLDILDSGYRESGTHIVEWTACAGSSGRGYASGEYIIVLDAGGERHSRSVVLLK
ncbi:MAG: hypothetical protein P9M15_07685 [Candidatus Electryoneaceae bacterium]|nr:hypothetical protein [Candidatus Electryoneaceae bacterium]